MMQLQAEDSEHLLVVDGSNTVAIWAYEDAPEVYRTAVQVEEHLRPQAFIARIPKGYGRNLDHITQDPYFCGEMLDVYTLADESKLYVGA